MQILKNILAFNGLGIGVPASQPHRLNRGDGITTPRLLAADAAGFTITADALNVTVTRTTGGASVNVYAELWHTLEDAEPYPGLAPTSFPFVIDANGGGGGGGGITELTSDVLAGPGSGAQAATVVALQGHAVDATAPANGQLLIGNAGSYTVASLTAGANVTITPGAGAITIAATAPTGFGAQFLGNGVDGALVFDGIATVLGLVPSTAPATSPYAGARVYVMNRDIFATSLAISANTVLVGRSHRVWCTGAITGPGKIASSGEPGVSATTNAGGNGGTGYFDDTLAGSRSGGNGGAGGNPNSVGFDGAASSTAPYGLTAGNPANTPVGYNNGTPGAVGQGGSGGSTGGTGAGGAGGIVTITNTTNGPYVATLPQFLTGRSLANGVFSAGSGGGGGAGGFASVGPTSDAGGGGGGGAGAGPLVVAAQSFAGGVAIEARGGNGGNGANATGVGVASGGAGGAGGAGGWVTVCYAQGVAPSVNVSGGTGGTGGTSVGGEPQAGSGGAGGTGLALVFNLGA